MSINSEMNIDSFKISEYIHRIYSIFLLDIDMSTIRTMTK